ncbi:MAG: Na/Pi cotransporter family protein [Bradymonadaceae bacterium]|nr:Na/Pi cotransporter family protein [Lujinxingiaceae bacterium]
MSLEIALNAVGGLALFLLAMLMMTDGLKVFAGSGLKRILGRWTSTPLRGVLVGIGVTGLVQSSSAVTVATIGFVNAGVLTLRQALGVIFGANAGTTMTGWLVSLVGFGFKIESFALPILTVGVVLRLTAPGARYRGLGQALAGFGLFFLGLAILKDAFGGLAATYGASVVAGDSAGNWAVFLMVGFIATVLTQSSSASIAIILTAATGGVVGIEAAAVAVIGANLGTTSTAAVAVLKATSSAKRLAMGHIAFNVLTGIVALALLPLLLWLIGVTSEWMHVEGSPAVVLAMFHTTFNLLGVIIMLPLAGRLATAFEKMFRSDEEDIGRAQHLDATLASTPALAVSALWQELMRLRGIVTSIVETTLSGPAQATALERQTASVHALDEAITGFVSSVQTKVMSEEVASELADALSTVRCLNEVTRLAPRLLALRQKTDQLTDSSARASMKLVLADAEVCLSIVARTEDSRDAAAALEAAEEQFEVSSEQAKKALLNAAVGARLSVEATNAILDALSATRRLVDQLVKGDRLLRRQGQVELRASKPAVATAMQPE